jgi:hypothetical protein
MLCTGGSTDPQPRSFRSWLLAIAVAQISLAACHGDAPRQPPAAEVRVAPRTSVVAAGAPVDLEYRITRFADASTIPADSWVFVHVVDASGALLWTDDHQPQRLSAASGDAPVVYQRTMFVPRTTPAGRVRIEAGLYTRASGERVPTDAGNTAPGFEVKPDPSGPFVVFGDGWHAAERVDQQQANEWRWSKGDARLSFRHPMRDVELAIELDQPVNAVGAQTVELRAGSDLLATFTVDPGVRRIHRVPLPGARLGVGPMAEVNLHVQPTFVPANMPNMTSSDTRELGVRVFNVYVGVP